MKSVNLLKISVFIALFGVLSLLYISETQSLELREIKSLSEEDLELKIKIQGKILSIHETPGLYILQVTDFTSTIPVIIFKESPLELQKNSDVIIEGKVTEYQGKLEIIADVITEKT